MMWNKLGITGRLWSAALLIATVTFPGLCHAQNTLSPATLGINVLGQPDDESSLKKRFNEVRALGIQQVRIDWMWRAAEAKKGIYDWSSFDRLMKVAHESGVMLLPIVHYAPDWALIPGNKPADLFEMAPDDGAFEAYAQFLVACVKRYGPGGNAPVSFDPIVYWEIWNEPDLKQFWGPAPQPDHFAKLMQTVSVRLKPYRGRIKLVHGGLSGADLMFLWELFEVDKKYGNTFDVLSVHLYLYDGDKGVVRQPSDMDADVPPFATKGFVGNPQKSNYLGKVFNLEMLMNQYGAQSKPIWITETGFFVSGKRLGVTEKEQADRMRTTLDFIKERLMSTPYGSGARAIPANVQRIYWFSLEDFSGSPDYDGNWGLYRKDGSMRPSGKVLQGYLH